MHTRWITVAAALCLATASLPAQRTSDVLLSSHPPGTATSLFPSIASVGSRVYVAWSDQRSGVGRDDVYFNLSTNGGRTWLPSDVRIDNSVVPTGSSQNVRVAAEGTAVYVVWSDDRNGQSDIYLNRSTDGGLTWTGSDVRLDTDTAGADVSERPQIAVAGQNVIVAWTEHRSGVQNVHVNRSLDGGATWLGSDVRVDTDGLTNADSQNCTIAATPTAAYVVWKDDRNSSTDVYVNSSTDGGGTWLGSDRLLSPTFSAGTTNARRANVVAQDDSAWVTWSDGQHVYVNRTSDKGVTWLGSEVRISEVGAMAADYDPGIAVDFASVYVTWADFRNGQGDIYLNRSLDFGVTWQGTDTRLDTSPIGGTYSFGPEIAANDNNVWVAWFDRRISSAGDIHFNVSTDRGATWLVDDGRFDTPPGNSNSSFHQVAASDSAVFAVWQDGRHDIVNQEIYFSSTGAVGVGGGCAPAEPPSCPSSPSSTAGFLIGCPTFTNPCTTTPVIILGTCSPFPLDVPPPIGCGACSLLIGNSFGTFPNPLSVVGPNLPPGFELCAQCGCIATFGGSLCVELSAGLELVMGP